MTTHTLTVKISDEIFQRLQARAHSIAQPVDTVVAQTIVQGLLSTSEEALPAALRDELDAMERLADDALWTIAQSTANDDTLALYDLLIERKQDGTLTPEGEHWLRQVSQDTDELMLRKAHAYVLLKRRGYHIPPASQLQSFPQ